MSQLSKLAKAKLNHIVSNDKSNQSTSSFGSGLVVGDSYQTLRALVTNVATGALSGLIHTGVMLDQASGIRFSGTGVTRTRRYGARAPRSLSRNFRSVPENVFPLALLLTIFIVPMTIFSLCNDTYATASSISVSVTAGSGAYINLPPTAEGKFGMAGPTTFSVATDHISGYTLTASATDLSFTDTEGNNGTVGATYTIDNLPTDTAIDATEFESNSNYKNKWGYLPDKYYSSSTSATITDNTNFFPAPITTPQTLDITTTANSIEEGETERTPNNYNITLGTKLDHTIAQGQYTTTITLTAVANPTPYTINYYANAGTDTVTNMPVSGTSSVDGDTATLSTTIPERPGYTFSRWCVATSVDNCYTSDNTTGAGNVYKPGGDYALDQTQTNTLNVYALWKINPCDETVYSDAEDRLYCKVQNQLKRQDNGLGQTQTLADMQAVITEPTSSDPAEDTSNSGVYEYDPDSNGIASDANNDYNIYYFRGILDSEFAESDDYGGIPSTGNSGYYQNYVRLADTSNDRESTCWRIVRTTGSGGVKMIYNGIWDDINNTCGNAYNNAGAVVNAYYNRGVLDSEGDNHYGTAGFAVYVGYNYDNNYAYNHTEYTLAILNSELFDNGTPSNARTQTENWYINDSNLSQYNNKGRLETSAGWCNDRSTTNAPTVNDATTPYLASSYVQYGPYRRNLSMGKKLSLTCANKTGHDLLMSQSDSHNAVGVMYPIALPTIDEMALVGHGYNNAQFPSEPTVASSFSSNFSYRSFLRSHSLSWLLSPINAGGTYVITGVLGPNGVSTHYSGGVYGANDIRPTISLTSSTTISSGSGTASDPWIVNASND